MSIPATQPAGRPRLAVLALSVAFGIFAIVLGARPSTATTCAYTLAASRVAIGMDGGPGSVGVTTADGCTWTTSSKVPWLTVTSDLGTRVGGGLVTFTVAGNTAPAPRSGTLSIAGKTYTVVQAPCVYDLNAPAVTFPPIGGDGSVMLTSGIACAWQST